MTETPPQEASAPTQNSTEALPPRDTIEARIRNMSPEELEIRRHEIVQKVHGSYEALSLEELAELSIICSTLRRQTSGPPRSARSLKKLQTKVNIEDLFID